MRLDDSNLLQPPPADLFRRGRVVVRSVGLGIMAVYWVVLWLISCLVGVVAWLVALVVVCLVAAGGCLARALGRWRGSVRGRRGASGGLVRRSWWARRADRTRMPAWVRDHGWSIAIGIAAVVGWVGGGWSIGDWVVGGWLGSCLAIFLVVAAISLAGWRARTSGRVGRADSS